MTVDGSYDDPVLTETPFTGVRYLTVIDDGRGGFAFSSVNHGGMFDKLAQASCGNGRRHRAPDVACTCGWYACRTVEELADVVSDMDIDHPDAAVVATVHTGGWVIEHERGFRSEWQEVAAVTVPNCRCGTVSSGFSAVDGTYIPTCGSDLCGHADLTFPELAAALSAPVTADPSIPRIPDDVPDVPFRAAMKFALDAHLLLTALAAIVLLVTGVATFSRYQLVSGSFGVDPVALQAPDGFNLPIAMFVVIPVVAGVAAVWVILFLGPVVYGYWPAWLGSRRRGKLIMLALFVFPAAWGAAGVAAFRAWPVVESAESAVRHLLEAEGASDVTLMSREPVARYTYVNQDKFCAVDVRTSGDGVVIGVPVCETSPVAP